MPRASASAPAVSAARGTCPPSGSSRSRSSSSWRSPRCRARSTGCTGSAMASRRSTITIVYAIWAAGTIAALIAVPFIVERIGRRGVMLAAVATMIVAAGVLVAWKALPGLIVGRLLTGLSVGLAAGTAITYLIELRLRADPNASPAPARTIGTSVNVGALGIGPLVAGCLAAVGELGRSRALPGLDRARCGRVGRSRHRAGDGRAGGQASAVPGQASRGGGRGDPRRLRGQRALRRAVRAVPRHHVSPPVARTCGRDAVHRLLGRGGVPARDGKAASVARVRTRDGLDARRSRASRDRRAPVDPESCALPRQRRA